MQRYMSLPTVAVLAILVYIVFFGESSVTQRIEYQRQIDSLSAEVAVAAVGREQTRRQHPQCACGVYPPHGAQHAESPRKQKSGR